MTTPEKSGTSKDLPKPPLYKKRKDLLRFGWYTKEELDSGIDADGRALPCYGCGRKMWWANICMECGSPYPK